MSKFNTSIKLFRITVFLSALLFNLIGFSQNNTYKPYIPFDKGLDKTWIQSLYEKGDQKVYSGDELNLIAMPCGGIGAGQIEITGEGRLGTWWIFNVSPPTNGGLGNYNGARYIQTAPVELPVDNGFVINIRSKNSEPQTLKLDGRDFNQIKFVGEYPIAKLKYESSDKNLPVDISSEVFSPFVPLSVRNSANPVTILRYTIKNESDSKLDINLGAWLENPNKTKFDDKKMNQVQKQNNLVGVQLGLESESMLDEDTLSPQKRLPIQFETFEAKAYDAKWTIKGDAFTDAPLDVASANFNLPVKNYVGKSVASSFHSEGKEDLLGSLISIPFKIERNSISFRIAGGKHSRETCINLVIEDEIVRTATGENSNELRLATWDVSDFQDKMARIEIIDNRKGSWGFIKVDEIIFADEKKPEKLKYGTGELTYGNLALSVLDAKATASCEFKSVDDFLRSLNTKSEKSNKSVFALDEKGYGTVVSSFSLQAQETKTISFLVSWYYPNLHLSFTNWINTNPNAYVGRLYDNWYNNSFEAAGWVADNYSTLYQQTKLFQDTYHATTLPYWLANRISMPVSTLAADNISLHKDGRMFAFEGVTFCTGTCGHVYNFVTAIASLFPELERSVRVKQDFNEDFGFDPKTGRINFRGYNGPDPRAENNYASDAQSGYVLKVYREHLHSKDYDFLNKIWPKVKLTMNYQIFRDGAERSLDPNGILEGKQTFWDPMWWGPNPYNNTLYLAALRAAEEMALIIDEENLAKRYHDIYVDGRQWMNENMWNGEYYVHLYPEGSWSKSWNGVVKLDEEQENASKYVRAFGEWDKHYYTSSACDAQQTFGQNWAHQLDLGYILPPENCQKAAASIYKYNYTPDIKLVYDLYPPHNRTLAASGEAAMVNGAWPKEKRKAFENTHDKDDIWTGLEYQAACDMINEGLLEEALIIIKSIDERYDAVKRNPWNEIEGAEHYSRAMHSWNVLLTLSGFTYNGPAGKIGFDPKITPDSFKCFFSGAEGWGLYQQFQSERKQSCEIDLSYGKLELNEITMKIPEGKKVKQVVVLKDDEAVKTTFIQNDHVIKTTFSSRIQITENQKLSIQYIY